MKTAAGNEPLIVGRYAIFDEIASGGMASVHFGRLMGPVGFSRTVAIKRLHPHLARNPQFTSMFLDEARIVARIRHPNVVPTLDVVEARDELILVMEYVDGPPLSELLSRARARGVLPPILAVVDIMISVLNGLHAAHEATSEGGAPLHIVHRDVSPQNILVGTDGIARVLDFGIAKAAGQAHHTRTGEIKGKLRYMPVEQITGARVTRAVDIYAASVVLWEALTCARLYPGASDPEILSSALNTEPGPPSVLRPEVSPELDAIVLRGLQRNPKDRWSTAKEMAQALEAASPPAKRSEVADWVQQTAPDLIERRLLQLACIEGEKSTVGAVPANADLPTTSGTTGPLETQNAISRSSQLVTPIHLSPGDASDAATGLGLARVLQRLLSRPKRARVGAGLVASAMAGLLIYSRLSGAPVIVAGAGAQSQGQEVPVARLVVPPEDTETVSPPRSDERVAPVAAAASSPSPAAASASSRRGASAPPKPQRRPGGADRLYRRE